MREGSVLLKHRRKQNRNETKPETKSVFLREETIFCNMSVYGSDIEYEKDVVG